MYSQVFGTKSKNKGTIKIRLLLHSYLQLVLGLPEAPFLLNFPVDWPKPKIPFLIFLNMTINFLLTIGNYSLTYSNVKCVEKDMAQDLWQAKHVVLSKPNPVQHRPKVARFPDWSKPSQQKMSACVHGSRYTHLYMAGSSFCFLG